MKILKKLLLTFSIFSLIMMFSFDATQAQTFTISGKQVKGSPGKNAQLTCQAVKITKKVKITSISGNNAGFWISNGSYTIKKYWKSNDATAKGLVLNPGTYYVYPNLKNGQASATVVLKLN